MPARHNRNVRGSRRRRRPNREQPKRFFVGVEGQSEQALVRWVEALCLKADRKVWFDVRIAGSGGGSTRAVVEHSLNNRNRSQRGPYAKTLIFLDEDRRVQDGPEAEVIARREGIHLVWQRWNMEGLLLRLFLDQENRWPPAERTLIELRRYWPNYEKNKIAASDLGDRFSLPDLQRAGRFDQGLMVLLEILHLEGR